MIERLPVEFKGRGEEKNYLYTQMCQKKLDNGNYAYVYVQRDISVDDSYVAGYEVVKPKVSNAVKIEIVEGKKTITKLDELKEYYPTTEEWGVNGFSYKTLEAAMKKFQSFF